MSRMAYVGKPRSSALENILKRALTFLCAAAGLDRVTTTAQASDREHRHQPPWPYQPLLRRQERPVPHAKAMPIRATAGHTPRRAFWLLTAGMLFASMLVACATVEPASSASLVPGILSPNYRAIAEKAGPAVVGVEVIGMRTPSPQEWDPSAGMPALPFKGKLPFHGQGSGFIVSSDGLVLTSAHVVEGARRITVRLSDRRQFRAELMGRDPITDVAVLRVSSENLPMLQMGDMDELHVGDPVMTIGSPFGLEQSVSQGIVSAKGRILPGFSTVPHIQTDVPVNPGHSGGPLLDSNGRVVGINAQIYTFSGGYQGMSFAVPIDVALRVKHQILTHGRMLHGYLGVTFQNLDLTLTQSFGLDRPRGALVSGVDPGSAADAGDVRVGDIVMAFNGNPLGQAGDLISHVGRASPGDQVRLSVWREKKAIELVVQLDQAMDFDEETALHMTNTSPAREELGWRLRPLTTLERGLLGVAGGLWIEEVSAVAAQAGLLAGDVLLSINLAPVHSLEAVRERLNERPMNAALLVERDGERRFFSIALD
ncbi:MAG: peptidase [Comamonadaceae bacterium]|nr:peptidase [Comamonadaceae bacterium]